MRFDRYKQSLTLEMPTSSDLTTNKFGGTIPPEIELAQNLTRLCVELMVFLAFIRPCMTMRSNSLQFLTPIPGPICRMLDHNQIGGTIPPGLTTLKKLQLMYASMLREAMRHADHQLTKLCCVACTSSIALPRTLSRNFLTGQIPDVSQLSDLIVLCVLRRIARVSYPTLMCAFVNQLNANQSI
jgi:hypothetical protein